MKQGENYLRFIFLIFLFVLLVGCDEANTSTVNSEPVDISAGSLREVSSNQTKEIKEDYIEPEDETIENPINLAFVGDIMVDWSVKEAIKANGPGYPFEQVKEDIIKADLAIGNLETAVTRGGAAEDKQYTFRSDPESLKGLKDAGFDILSLANNHTLDYGEEGLLDTMEYMKKYNLAYMGAGKNDDEAFAAVEKTIKGKTIKFLGFSQVLPTVSWYSGENKPGIANAYQQEKVIETIKKEKKDVDFVFVYIHWGAEKVDWPSDKQRAFAKNMIDAGADGIIGGHAHVLQGFEYYKGKPIAYSLGNFLFPDYVSGRSAETGVLNLILQGAEIKMDFKPYYIQSNQIVKKDQNYIDQQLAYLESVSYLDSFTGNELVFK